MLSLLPVILTLLAGAAHGQEHVTAWEQCVLPTRFPLIYMFKLIVP